MMLTLAACQQEKIAKDPVTKYIAMIEFLGFDTSDLIEEGEYYVVEGCILLEKAHLADYVAPSTRQWHTGSSVSRNNVSNVSVRISSNLSTDWKNAIADAINEWNNISGTDIRITVTTSTTANLSIQEISAGNSYIAQATWPKNGAIGPIIRVNTYYNYISYAEKKYTIVHEIGHCLGLRHTNWQGYEPQSAYDSESGQNINAVLIPGTPQTDANSVMNRIVRPWQGFSSYDLVAIRHLYYTPTAPVAPPLTISFWPPSIIPSEGGEGYYIYKFRNETPSIVINSAQYEFITGYNPEVYINRTWAERDYTGKIVDCVEIWYSHRATGPIEIQALFYVNGYSIPWGRDYWFDVFDYH